MGGLDGLWICIGVYFGLQLIASAIQKCFGEKEDE